MNITNIGWAGWIGVIVAGAMVADGVSAAMETANNLQVLLGVPYPKIVGGKPFLVVPVTLNNHTKHTIPVDHLVVTVDRWAAGAWTTLASSQPDLANLRIEAFASTKLNLELQTGAFNAINNAVDLFFNRGSNRLRVLTKATVSGITVPHVQEFNNI